MKRITESGNSGSNAARVDQGLQPNRATQRPGNEITRAILCRLVVKKQENACPKLGGADQVISVASSLKGDIVLVTFCFIFSI